MADLLTSNQVISSSEETKTSNFLKVQKQDLLRKREDFAVSLRKQNKIDKLSKKRAKTGTKAKNILPINEQEVFLSHPALADQTLPPEEKLCRGLDILQQQHKDEVDVALIIQLRRLLGNETFKLTYSEHYPQILTERIECIKMLCSMLAECKKPLQFMRELSWFLLNMTTFPQQSAAEFIDNECHFIYSACQCIQESTIQIREIKKQVQQEYNDNNNDMEIAVQGYQKITENCIWLISNVTTNCPLLIERAIKDYHILNLIANSIRIQEILNIDLIVIIEQFLDVLTPLYKDEWYLECEMLFNAISAFIHLYLEQYANDDCKFLKFIIRYTDREEQSLDIVMEQLEINSVLIKYLASNNYNKFSAALRMIGNISSSSLNVYIENLFKNGLYEALTAGLSIFHDDGIYKEIGWLFSNIIANGSIPMTKSLLSNQVFVEHIKNIMTSKCFVAQKEICHMILNLVKGGYSLEILNLLICDHDFLTYIVLFVDPEKNCPPRILDLVLRFLEILFYNEKALSYNAYYRRFEELGGIDLVEELQQHQNQQIYELAADIIKNYGDGQRVDNNFENKQTQIQSGTFNL